MTASEAKEFLISRIVAEASSQGISLSETERQMLYWSEVYPPANIPDLQALAARFDAECDSGRYEEKIRNLAAAAWKRDSAYGADAERWNDAMRALSKEDHYISVMLPGFDSRVVSAGQQHRTRDVILYLVIALAIVAVITIYTFYRVH